MSEPIPTDFEKQSQGLETESLIKYRCNVVIEKQGSTEVICPQDAQVMTTLVDPDNQTKVTAIVLLCKKHNDDMEDGKPLVVVSADGKSHFMIQQTPQEETHDADATPAPRDGARPKRTRRSKSNGRSGTRRTRRDPSAAGHAADPGQESG